MHYGPIVISLLVATCHTCPATPQAWLDIQQTRWDVATIPERHKPAVDKVARRVERHKARYEAVADDTGVPWYVIAALHNMESSGSFRRHLHEGSPLTRRTRWVPKGRPKHGSPPFTWEESAQDALQYDRMDRIDWDSLRHALYGTERYNGTGYLRYHPETPSQYNWSKTSVARAGKYIADGKFSRTAWSAQVGVAALWKTLGVYDPKPEPKKKGFWAWLFG